MLCNNVSCSLRSILEVYDVIGSSLILSDGSSASVKLEFHFFIYYLLLNILD
jgi:hypothetical protein